VIVEIIDHRLVQAQQLSSENCDERPSGEVISLIVVHGISLPAGHFGTPYVEQLFCNRLDCDEHTDFADLVELKVSSHLFIRRSGEVLQFVPFDKRAWHAGVSSYNGRERCNDFAIGIELEGLDWRPYQQVQYQVLAEVCFALCQHSEIPDEAIVGHSDIAPGRKTDPGPSFVWQKLNGLIQELKGA